MKIQAFVCNWVGHEENAAALERQMRGLCDVEVINTDSAAASRHPSWHYLDKDSYFTKQWNRLLELFNADVLLQIQADASFTGFAEMLERCRSAIREHGCGVYAPNVNYTFWTFDRARLKPIAADLFEVPHTDCTCWAVAREVLEQTPRVDPLVNKFGWGIDWMVIAVAQTLRKRVARDYRFTVIHPRGTGYDKDTADRQAQAMLARLPSELREMHKLVWREAESARTRSRWERYYVLLQQLKWLAGWRR